MQATSAQPLDIGLRIHHLGAATDEHAPPGPGLLVVVIGFEGGKVLPSGRGKLLFAFRLGERAAWRLLATRPAGTDPQPFGQPGPSVPATELQALVDDAGLGVQIGGLAGRTVRLHELLARPGVHVLLERDADQLDDLATGPMVHVHRLTSVPGRGLTAVRPDGHVGFRCHTADAHQLTAWLAHTDVPQSCQRRQAPL